MSHPPSQPSLSTTTDTKATTLARLPSQRFDSFSNFAESESMENSAVSGGELPIYVSRVPFVHGGGCAAAAAVASEGVEEEVER
ncbi:hypothetical protein RHMOL_Rhmol07G0031100 [Rhododendron molle]|uniref:Uncharacterized protein n=1 Tax=Rhododendron molle TaxID=49168 RepID=A0ACC0MXK8_RHOML|nr:hypothetical protein RHMOL_Rhmol07G0031100 [Rhododendron molle]